MKILLIGCGNIGGSLLKTLNKHEVFVIDPSITSVNYKNVKIIQKIDNLEANAIILAIKPQTLNEIEIDIKAPLMISTLAGVKVKALKKKFPNQKIIRVMPNMGIKTSKSVNLAFVGTPVTKEDIDTFKNIFENSGKIFFLDDEKKIDDLTPIFGCGPAYFFLIADIMMQYLIHNKISNPKDMMDELLEGVASLAKTSDYKNLIESISSKKGVTEAVINSIRDNINNSMEYSFDVALKKIEELSNENSR